MRIEFTRSREDEIKARQSFADNQHAKVINPPVLIYFFGFCFFVHFAYYGHPFSRSRLTSYLQDEVFVTLCLLLIIVWGFYFHRILSIRQRVTMLFPSQDELDNDHCGEVSLQVEAVQVLINTQHQQISVPLRGCFAIAVVGGRHPLAGARLPLGDLIPKPSLLPHVLDFG